ncbi:MAG: carboxypeptidase-like regulatory domain-containing protein [Pyrinomonadaceae bacterium]
MFSASRQFTVVREGRLGPITVNWSFVARRLFDRDLTVDRLEVTQGLQDRANSIPLVQGRRTVVRAYLGVGKEQAAMENVTGQLTVFSGGTELGSVEAFNPGGRITARPQPDWLSINHTLNFEVPIEWTRVPSLRFEVEVNDDHSVFETDYTNNKLSASLTSKDCNTGINIGYVPIWFDPPEGNFGWPPNPDPKIHVAQEFMRKIYPIPEKGLNYTLLPTLWWRQSLNYADAGDDLLRELKKRRLTGGAPGTGHIFGWLPVGGYTFAAGFADLPGFSAWGQDGNFWRLALAHEIGHNKGLNHEPGGTTAGSHWFDVYERKIKPPYEGQQLLGMMQGAEGSGDSPYWMSPTSYRLLMGKMCSTGAQAPQAVPQSPTVTDNLIVTGRLSNLTIAAGTLDPLYRTTTAQSEIPRVGTSYCVKLKNAAGSVLSQYCFDMSFEGEGTTPPPTMSFGMAVPYPVGLSRVELTKGTAVLSSRLASANPPAVTLTFPNASGMTLSGVQNITWNGSDPDGGTLTYSLLYSRDNGATWLGVGSSIVGNSHQLDFSSLPGGTGGLIKVMVSDGFRSSEDVGDNTFTIANKPPIAAIVSPPTGTRFPVNTKLTLQATGADLEDGSLSDTAFRWSSDRAGLLGTGQVLEVNLSTGNHIITLTAQDSGGLTSTATITCNAVSTTTSPPVTVSGRVTTPDGRGLRNATVSITDSLGMRRTVTTSSFGFYSFDDVRSGEPYTIAVSSKRYRFAARSVQVDGNLSNLDFIGLE